ncbi:MAG: 4-(cytidine 5'-diphospho)-2-C-methyl-D-erythritol kinase [Syntrophales bacterium]|jgi:4-diphosphocytidyl-2-C-methyl-D-erythritol kinase
MISKLSPAKVNLHLRVLGKRRDGFHDISTLMQRISLYDELIFAETDHGIRLSCPGSAIPEDNGNIVYRAADALLSRLSHPPGIHITIRKKIPVGAGLGGGSSNAATALVTLNELMELHHNTDDLMKIGAKLGADVPFFIFGRTAWASGIGDRLRIAENIPHLWFVLINPGFEISTKVVYESLNLRLTKRVVNYKCPVLCTVDEIAKGLQNDLERVTLVLHPILRYFKNILVQNGALGALMSGSGPTVMGIFTDEEGATAAKKVLENTGGREWSVLTARSV